MKKLITGAIAGTVGIALLLGGAGTFALWNTSAPISAQTVTAGHLNLTAGSGSWATSGGTAIPNITTYRIVPGTTVVYTTTLSVDAVGDGIKAQLTSPTLAGTGTLNALVTKTLDVTSTTATVVNASTLQFAAGTSTVNVKVTIAFPSTVSNQDGMDGTLALSALSFTLAQTL